MMNRIPARCLLALLVLILFGGCDQSGSAGTSSSTAGNATSASVPAPPPASSTAQQPAAPILASDTSKPPVVDLDSIPIGYTVGLRAPEWRLRDPSGKEHALSDYRGNVVVMDFWATWCGPCRMAMPGMQKLHEELASRHVKVFGITTGERSDPAAYMASKNYTYGLLVNGDKVARQYGVRGIPAFFVVGVDGRVLHTASGFDPTGQAERDLHSVIVKHLDEHGL